MATERLTLTEADVEGFQRVCRYLWRRGCGTCVDLEDVDDNGVVHTHRADGRRTDGAVSCTALIGASIDLEIPDGPF